jgi:putative membrane protein
MRHIGRKGEADMRRVVVLGAFMVSLAGAAAAESLTEKTGVNSALGVSPTTADFVKEVAISDMFEIQSSQLAKDKAKGAITAFADHMIADHQKTSSELKSLVKDGSVTEELPDGLDSAHQQKLDKLKTLNGEDFNKAYDADQVKAHKSAVDLFERYAKGGDNAALKQWAAATLPTLESHLSMAQNLD